MDLPLSAVDYCVTVVSVPAIDKLPTVIDTLIKAVAAGELDQQLAAVGKIGRPVLAG